MSIRTMRQNFAQYLKPILIAIAGLFLVSCFMGYGGYISEKQQREAGGKGVVATVNGQDITREEYAAALQRLTEQYKAQGTELSVTSLAQQKGAVLDQMIDQHLRLQAAAREGVKVSRRQIKEAINKFVESQLDTVRQNVSGKKKLSDWEVNRLLSRLPQPTSLRKISKETRRSMDPKAVRSQLMIEGLDKKLDERFKSMTDQDFLNSFKRVRARHILVKTGSLPEEQAKRRAEEILKKVKAGGDFAALAREYSEDPGSKDKGGDLGFFGPGMMVPEFEKAAFALQPGQTSGLVKSPYGYHIIKVEEAKMEFPPDFEKNKKKLRQQFGESQGSQRKAQYYQDLRAKSKIVVRDPELSGYMALTAAYRGDPSQRDKKLVEAVRSYERAIRDDPKNYTAWVMIADIRMQQGQKAEAQKIYENLLEGREPIEDAELRIRLGQLYRDAKQDEKALEQFEIASDVGYANPQIHYQLQYLYKQMKREDLAAKEQQMIDEFTRRMQEGQGARGGPQPVRPRPGR